MGLAKRVVRKSSLSMARRSIRMNRKKLERNLPTCLATPLKTPSATSVTNLSPECRLDYSFLGAATSRSA